MLPRRGFHLLGFDGTDAARIAVEASVLAVGHAGQCGGVATFVVNDAKSARVPVCRVGACDVARRSGRFRLAVESAFVDVVLRQSASRYAVFA